MKEDRRGSSGSQDSWDRWGSLGSSDTLGSRGSSDRLGNRDMTADMLGNPDSLDKPDSWGMSGTRGSLGMKVDMKGIPDSRGNPDMKGSRDRWGRWEEQRHIGIFRRYEANHKHRRYILVAHRYRNVHRMDNCMWRYYLRIRQGLLSADMMRKYIETYLQAPEKEVKWKNPSLLGHREQPRSGEWIRL